MSGVPRLRELAAGVLVATSDMYLTNTTAVVHGREALLVDPGVLPGELGRLAEELVERGLTVTAGFSTHPHWDHVLWSSALGGAPRWATAAAVAALAEHGARLVEEPMRSAGERWYSAWEMEQVSRLSPLAGGSLDWGGPPARLLVHDAHAPGHAALHFPDLGLLVAGDMVSDVELPGFDWGRPDQLDAYLAGLEVLAGVQGVRLFVPGHGHAGDGAELERRLAADRAYVEALKAGREVDDPRLDAWPPMRAQHEENLRELAAGKS